MMLSAIADHLQLNGCGTAGQTIFEYEMPGTCKDGILLMDSYYGTPINHEMRGYHAAEFRVIVRATDLVAGRALAQKASNALEFQTETAFGDLYIVKQSLPENEPRVYKRSVGGYWEFEVDVQCVWVDA